MFRLHFSETIIIVLSCDSTSGKNKKMILMSWLQQLKFRFGGALFALLFLSQSSTCFGQAAVRDSLLRIWNDSSKPDSARLVAINKLKSHYIFSDVDTAIIVAQLEYDLAKKLGNDWHLCAANISLGWLEWTKADYAKSIDHYMAVIQFKAGSARERWKADATIGLGNVHYAMKDLELAEKYYREGIQMHESQNDYKGTADGLINLANVFADQGKSDEAVKQYLYCYRIRQKQDDVNGMGMCLNNIAYIYADEGLALFQDGDTKAAFQIQDSAIFYFNKSIDLYEQANDLQGIAGSLINIASVYMDREDYSKAEPYYLKSLNLAKTANLAIEKRKSAHGLYACYSMLGKWAEALEMFELFVVTRDSIESENNQRAAMKQQYQFEYEKKEVVLKAEQEKKDAVAAEKIQRRNVQRNASLIGLAFMLVVSIVVVTQRNRIAKEKQRSEELLLNILPYETAQELKDKGSSDAQLMDHVTVLFTDFKGFTALSEQLSPKELVADLHQCFSEFDRICEKYGIEKIKTIGDAYMAAGGLPVPSATHAQDVVRAGLEMAQVVALGKAKKIAEGLPFFEIRIGIHTGPVVAGIVGIKKFQYDIWGDTVNTASRMESSGEIGRVNVSQSTYELVKNDFLCTHRGKVAAKGKGEIDMYFVDWKG